MENWIILNSTTGNSGETQITLQVAENTNYSARTTTLTVRTRSKNLTDTVVINQQARAATGQMTFNPSALSYTYEGGTIPFSITANEDWRVVSWPTWVGISGDGTSGGTGTYNWGVTALRNSTTSDLDSTFTFYCGGNYFTVPVHQDAYSEQPTGSTEYLTFEIISGGTIYWKTTGNTHTVEYQINGGSWNSITSSTGGTPITVSSGDIVKWRGDNSNYNNSSFSGTTAGFKVKNNIMSLIDSDNYASLDSLQSAYTFYYLFQNCTGLTDASKLILPATALTNCCYWGMFEGCTSLTTVPELPATTLANSCYRFMFWNCYTLTTAPELPATTLASQCYWGMFGDCVNLTTAPELPATTLALGCYQNMFQSCISFTTAPALPATTLADSCYFGMFQECRNLTTAPELPATTLAEYCYYGMFRNCSSLNYIKCLATDISATDCTTEWVYGVAPTGTFVKADSMTGWTIDSVDGVPIGWTLINASDENPDYSKEYLTFDIISGGTIYWACSNTASTATKTIEYKINGGSWNSITSSYSLPMDSTGGTSINVSTGDIVKFRGDNSNYSASSSSKINYFKGSTCKFKLKGNIMSLIDSVNFENLKSFNTAYNFVNLFYNCTGLTDASELVLPVTALTNCCYWGMFEGCTSLTSVPSLPATTLANDCYCEMFHYCTSLSTVPSNYLPVTTLSEYCYSDMFAGCTSLTTAPELPATTLVRECYSNMFEGCTSLTTAPELPATTLAYWCYYQMFSGCSNLNYIKCLATDISATYSTRNWVSGVASTGTFVKNSSMTSWTTGTDGIPTGWTVQDAS